MWKHTNNLLTSKEEKLRMKLQMKENLPCSLYSTARGYYFSKLLFLMVLVYKRRLNSLFPLMNFPFIPLKVNFIYSSRAEVRL